MKVLSVTKHDSDIVVQVQEGEQVDEFLIHLQSFPNTELRKVVPDKRLQTWINERDIRGHKIMRIALHYGDPLQFPIDLETYDPYL